MIKIALLTALALGLLFAGIQVSTASAGGTEATLRIDSATANVGQTVSVDITAEIFGKPGIGAWTFDISYDPDTVSMVRCLPYQGGVCSVAFADDAGRLTGASSKGLIGETKLGTFYFQCGEHPGSSDIELSVEVFADATPDNPQDVDEEVINGAITCGEGFSPGVIRIDSATGDIGEEVQALLHAEHVVDPPLGAWTADISYDREFVTLIACSAYQGGVCVPNPELGVVRVTGASARGLTGDFPLALLTFRCADGEGETPLTVELEFFSTAGITGFPESQDGTLTCVLPGFPTGFAATPTPHPVLPPTGSGQHSSASPWPLAVLAALGGVAFAGAALVRGRA